MRRIDLGPYGIWNLSFPKRVFLDGKPVGALIRQSLHRIQIATEEPTDNQRWNMHHEGIHIAVHYAKRKWPPYLKEAWERACAEATSNIDNPEEILAETTVEVHKGIRFQAPELWP